MSDLEQLPPLPPELRREAARLRALEPAADFDKRLRASLAHAEAERAARAAAKRPLSLIWAGRIALVLPLLLAVVLIAHFGLGSTTDDEYLERVDAVDVILGEQGSALVNLDMWTQHHKGSDATVHVDVPNSVEVVPTEYATTIEDAGPRCDDARCTYRFEHPNAHPDRQPVQIGIRSPGQYRIRVEHASRTARVREELVVRARAAADAD